MLDLDRGLPLAPPEPLDETGAPRIGAFAGSLERIDLAPLLGKGLGRHWRKVTQQKRWQYVMLTSREVVLSFAIVDLGYAANGFCFAVDRVQRQQLFDRGYLGLPQLAAEVGERPGQGARSHFKSAEAEMHFERVASRYIGTVRIEPELSLNFTLETQNACPAVTMVVPIHGGTLNVTQKWSGLSATGSLVIGKRRFDLDGGWGGLDYTYGLLARENTWRWAFASGVASDGQPVGFNMGEGFNASVPGENSLFYGSSPAYLPDVHFTFDRSQPLSPWRLRSDDGSVDLHFHPSGLHQEKRNLGLVKSRFVQVAGEFTGQLRGPGGRTIAVAGLPGVVEDQFVRW